MPRDRRRPNSSAAACATGSTNGNSPSSSRCHLAASAASNTRLPSASTPAAASQSRTRSLAVPRLRQHWRLRRLRRVNRGYAGASRLESVQESRGGDSRASSGKGHTSAGSLSSTTERKRPRLLAEEVCAALTPPRVRQRAAEVVTPPPQKLSASTGTASSSNGVHHPGATTTPVIDLASDTPTKVGDLALTEVGVSPRKQAQEGVRAARLRSMLGHYSGLRRLKALRLGKHRDLGAKGFQEYRVLLQNVVAEADGRTAEPHPEKDEGAASVATDLLERLRAVPRPERPRVPPLSTEERDLYERHVCGSGDAGEVLASRFNIDLTRSTLQCMAPQGWLNDEVLNFYCKLLQERNTKQVDVGAPRCWFTNSFFWNKLSGGPAKENAEYNYAEVRRWTTRASVDIFALDCVVFPMNVGEMHWALGVIDLRDKGFRYFDSMSSRPHHNFVPFLRRYLSDEYASKKGGAVLEDVEAWDRLPEAACIPQQRNYWDCGVFTCFFADAFAAGRPFHFDQDDMPDLRVRLAARLVKAEETWSET